MDCLAAMQQDAEVCTDDFSNDTSLPQVGLRVTVIKHPGAVEMAILNHPRRRRLCLGQTEGVAQGTQG